MKRHLTLAVLSFAAASMIGCAGPPPPRVVEHHYYRTNYYRERETPTYRYIKPAGVSGGSYSSSPEGFQAVSPPSSYSQ